MPNFHHNQDWAEKASRTTMDWNRLMEMSGPLTREASRELYRSRIYFPRRIGSQLTFPTPLAHMEVPPGCEDLTGQVFGSFVVTGLFTIQYEKARERVWSPVKKTGMKVRPFKRWQVQCRCGNYTIRMPKQLREASRDMLMCGDCIKEYHMFKHDFKWTTGQYPNEVSEEFTNRFIEWMHFTQEESKSSEKDG